MYVLFAQETNKNIFDEKLITQVNWDEFQKDLFVISPDSKRVIFVLKQNNKYYISDNGKKSEAFDFVKNIVFSNDSKHYCALVKKGDKFGVLFDGKLGKLYSFIDYGPVFSPNSQTYLYKASLKNKSFIVINTKEEKKYDSIDDPIFSSTGKSYGYSTFSNNAQWVVINGKESKKYELISGDITFSGDGSKAGYVIYKDIYKSLIIDDKEQSVFFDIYENTLKFDYLGNNYIFVAKDSNLSTVFVKNNIAEGKYSSIDTTIISKDGQNYYYTANYSYSDYKKNFATVTEYYVVHNGNKIGTFDDILKNSLITDSTGRHYVFTAKKNGKWHIYYDGISIAAQDYPSFPYLSYDGKTVVYISQKSDNKMSMVINNKEGEVFDQVFYPVFNPADNSVVYAAKLNNKIFIVKDGVKQKEYDDMHFYFFSFTGKFFVNNGITENKNIYSVNGKESKKYDEIKYASFSKDDKNLYLLVREGNEFRAILNDNESKLYSWIGGNEIFDYNSGILNFIGLNNNSLYYVSTKLNN